MKKIYFLLLVIFILNGCKTLNKKELLGEIPECVNKICKNMDVLLEGKNLYINNKYKDAKNYLLNIKSYKGEENTEGAFMTALSLGTIPHYAKCNISLDATLKTKEGTLIKTYHAKGPTKSNIAAIFSYSSNDAIQASILESMGDALRDLYQQINTDDKVYADAEKIIKEEATLIEKRRKEEDALIEKRKKEKDKKINELKKIIDGHRFVQIQGIGSIIQICSSLNHGDIVYLASVWLGPQKFGLFAGQNVIGEGNLADFESPYGTDKVFLYGKFNYTDGQPLKGYYKYNGNYTYTTVLGATKTVPSFQEIDIPEELIKYIDLVK